MTEKPMMIVEGIKTLGVITDKMEKNIVAISSYSSQVSTERPKFETEEKQRKAVKELTQSNEDLNTRYLQLKERVDYSNLMTTVEWEGKKYSILQLLVLQRTQAKMMLQTYNALNDKEGETRLRLSSHHAQSTGEPPRVVRYYKEEDKREHQRVWDDLLHNITVRLEVVNATSPLLELPSKS